MAKTRPLHARVQHYAAHGSAVDFFNALTAPDLLDTLDAHLPVHRERLFPPTDTLSMFLSQALSADGRSIRPQRSVCWRVYPVAAQPPVATAGHGPGCRWR